MALTKQERRLRIKRRIRKQISGSATRPRMSVFRSNKQIYVQFIDDLEGKTLLSVCSRNKEVAEKGNVAKIEQAKLVGELAAKKAIENGITEVVFDRNGYLYHGRVKSLAEAAREGGLKF
jgi:large subunit ribosomal protein L18